MSHWQVPLRTIEVRRCSQVGAGTTRAQHPGLAEPPDMPRQPHHTVNGFQSKHCSVEHAVPYLKETPGRGED